MNHTESQQSASRKQRKEQTRQAILDGAIFAFAELGFDAASMGLIAERCGVKKALVQYHFETKEKLWKAAVSELWQQRSEALPSYFGDAEKASNVESLRFIFKQIVRFSCDHPEWVGIMFREAAQPSTRLDWLFETHLKDDYKKGLAFIEKAQELGYLPPLEPLPLIHIISGALFYIILIAPVTLKATGEDIRSEQFLDIYVDTLLNMINSGNTTQNGHS